MIKGKIKKPLLAESILEKISEYDIFMFYMPHKGWKLNVVTLSPFRNERNPSFIIGNKHGKLTYIDFADTSKRGDCFTFVQQLFNLAGMRDVLLMIDRDFKLGISTGEVTEEYKKITSAYKQPEDLGKRYSLIQVVTRKLTLEELAYWNQYHQDIEDLKKNQVYGISKLYFNKKLFPLKETELKFGYFYDGHWKI